MAEKIEFWLAKQPHVLGFITKETTFKMGAAVDIILLYQIIDLDSIKLHLLLIKIKDILFR